MSPSDRPRVYFAHPINTYRTALERRCIGFLKAAFPGHTIVNPGSRAVAKRVEAIKARFSPEEYDTAGSRAVMQYFLDDRIPGCAALVGLPYPDGMYLAGVGKEMLHAHERGIPVWSLTHILALARICDPSRDIVILSIDETRRRVYEWPSRVLRPYPSLA